MTHPNRGAMLDAAASHARSLTATYGRPPSMAEYNATRPDRLPASSTLRLIYEIQWSAVIAASAVRDPAAEAAAAEQPTPQPLPAGEIVTVPPPVVTGSISNEPEPPAPPPTHCRRGSALAEIENNPLYAGLPRPQRDPLTGQLIPPRDAAGHAIWRVRVYGADERTCAMCGETFTPRIVRNSHGAPMQIGYCERCGVEDRDGAGAPVAAPNVRALAYLQDGEAEIVAMVPA